MVEVLATSFTSWTLEISMRGSAGILMRRNTSKESGLSWHYFGWKQLAIKRILKSECELCAPRVAVLTRISNQIVTDRVYDFHAVGVRLEEAAYNSANGQEEYVQRICAKLAQFWMQTTSRQANSSNPNGNYVHQATSSASQTANMNAPDRQEVAYQKVVILSSNFSSIVKGSTSPEILHRMRHAFSIARPLAGNNQPHVLVG